MGHILLCLRGNTPPTEVGCRCCKTGSDICVKRLADYVPYYRPRKYLVKRKKNTYGDVATLSTNILEVAKDYHAQYPRTSVIYVRMEDQ